MVAPFNDFQEPPTGGSEFAASLKLSSVKLKTINPLSAKVKKKVNVPLHTEVNYTHMLDNKIADNTPILKELDSTITQEPTLEELNEEGDRLEFTNNTTWTFTADARAREKS